MSSFKLLGLCVGGVLEFRVSGAFGVVSDSEVFSTASITGGKFGARKFASI